MVGDGRYRLEFPFEGYGTTCRRVAPADAVVHARLKVTFGDEAGRLRRSRVVGACRTGPRDEEGGVRTNYARTGDGSKVSILIRPKLDQRFRDDRALGTVSFSWTPPKTN